MPRAAGVGKADQVGDPRHADVGVHCAGRDDRQGVPVKFWVSGVDGYVGRFIETELWFSIRLTHKLTTRLAVLGLATVLLCMGAFGILQANRTDAAGNRAAQASQVADAFAGARLALERERGVTYEYQLQPSPGLGAEFLRDKLAVDGSLATAAELVSASQQGATHSLIVQHQVFTGAVRRIFADVVAAHHGRALGLDRRVVDPIYVALAGGVTAAADRAGALAGSRVLAVRALQSQSATVAPIAAVIGLVLLGVFIVVLVRAGRREAIQKIEMKLLDRAAAHDPLTGLANRRKLTLDLDAALVSATDAQPTVLFMFDLDGFKSYNDRFGHPTGDTLLARLTLKLSAAVGDAGESYRLGGDEFCVLLRAWSGDPSELEGRFSAALHESGEGFSIGCSRGVALLPRDASDAPSAMLLADQRLYVTKNSRRAPAAQQGIDVRIATGTQPRRALGPEGGRAGARARSRTMSMEPPHSIAAVRVHAEFASYLTPRPR